MKVTIDTTQDISCVFAGCREWPTYRHHMGCDHYIGKFNLLVKIRYAQFLDCCRVCDKHHMWVHYNYQSTIRRHTDFTPSGALKLRAKLIRKCKRLISGEDKLRKPTKSYVKEWRRRRRKWKRSLREQGPRTT